MCVFAKASQEPPMSEIADVSASTPSSAQISATPLWKKLLVWAGGALLLLAGVGAYLWMFERTSHTEPAGATPAIVASGDPLIDAIRLAAEYVKARQETDGHFSKGLLDPKPAFTAMVVDALARSPEKYRERDHPFMQKAVGAILGRQQKNGSICTPAIGLDSYVTSVCIMALTALENPAYAETIEQAKQFLLSVQNTDEGSPMQGGAGYAKGKRPSGDVTGQWVEALKNAGVKAGDPAFENAQKFLQRLQNNPETNHEAVPGTEVGSDGGFFYRPGESNAGFETGPGGKKAPRSYGLMSYQALKAFLYMSVSKEDPRVISAHKWVCANYTLEENRNLGADGLYYYYMTMAKALAAYGEPEIVTPDGTRHNWANELAAKLIALQNENGSWRNIQSSKWMEDDAVLSTTYAIRALAICHEEKNRRGK
jgi:squalene-hopene/tetraprenyl-beta-curcumene cyclase